MDTVSKPFAIEAERLAKRYKKLRELGRWETLAP